MNDGSSEEFSYVEVGDFSLEDVFKEGMSYIENNPVPKKGFWKTLGDKIYSGLSSFVTILWQGIKAIIRLPFTTIEMLETITKESKLPKELLNQLKLNDEIKNDILHNKDFVGRFNNCNKAYREYAEKKADILVKELKSYIVETVTNKGASLEEIPTVVEELLHSDNKNLETKLIEAQDLPLLQDQKETALGSLVRLVTIGKDKVEEICIIQYQIDSFMEKLQPEPNIKIIREVEKEIQNKFVNQRF